MILFWFLKSLIEFASVKNSGLNTISIFLYFSFHLDVVPGGIVDLTTIVEAKFIWFILAKRN